MNNQPEQFPTGAEKQPGAEKEQQPTIRLAALSDTEQIRRLHQRSWRDTYPDEANGVSRDWIYQRTADCLTPEKLAESRDILAATLADKKQYYRVAERDGKIVGFVHGSVKDDGSGELLGIYLDKSELGTGLAQQLVQGLDAWLTQSGVKTAELTVAKHNARAIHFYQKLGYQIVPNSQSLYADYMPVIRMKRESK